MSKWNIASSMMSRSSRGAVIVAALVLLASPVAAELFTVTLVNGREFETRYLPLQSATDEGKIQLLTDTGNWISLPKDVVVSIVSETESKGFGIVIDNQTIFLGWDPTSLAMSEQVEGGSQDPADRLLEYLMEQDQARAQQPPPFSNELVTEPSEAGGIPIWMTGMTTPPLGQR